MKANVYYLTWDEDRNERNWDKQDIRDGEAEPEDFEHYRPVMTLEGVDGPDEVWARLNRDPTGYEAALDELEERSMCKGDLIVMDGKAQIVKGIGFQAVSLETDEAPEPEIVC